MKTQLKTADEATGKIVERVVTHECYVAVHFTDGTVLVSVGYEKYGGVVLEVGYTCDVSRRDALELGIATRQERKVAREVEKNEEERRIEERELQELARLRLKYDEVRGEKGG